MGSIYSKWRDTDGPLAVKIRRLLDQRAHAGLTVHELYPYFETTDIKRPDFASHGWISGCLSTLHGEGAIVRLSEQRGGAKVYIAHPDFLDGRKAEAQGRGAYDKEQRTFFATVEDFLDYWLTVDQSSAKITTTKTRAEKYQRLFFTDLIAIWGTRPEGIGSPIE